MGSGCTRNETNFTNIDWKPVTRQETKSTNHCDAQRTEAAPPWMYATVVVVTCLVFAPFLNKAYHIDDTLFLRVADQIRQSPTQPFDFEYNWYNSPTPMWEATLNPPLQGYFLALIRQLGGTSEIVAHSAHLLLNIGSSLFMFGIARRFCSSPMLALFLSLIAPGYLISLTNVMAENILVFFWLAAIYLTINAADNCRPARLWLAGLAATAAVMAKYFGIALIPLLFVYAIFRHKDFTASGKSKLFHFTGLLLPLVALGLWCWHSYVQTGKFHPLEAASFSNDLRFNTYMGNIIRTSNALIYFSGMLLWAIWLIPAAWLLPMWQKLFLVAVTVLAVLFQQFPVGPVDTSIYSSYEFAFYIVLLDSALIVVLMGLNGACQRRDSATLLLVLWAGGTLFFAAYFNWTVNARVVLPALFPTILLVIRWMETVPNTARWKRWLAIGSVPTLAVSMLLATVDYQYANASRRFVDQHVRPLADRGETIHISGHWGFQYYLEELGATPINESQIELQAGDIVVAAENNPHLPRIDFEVEAVARLSVTNPYRIHVMSEPSHAGFYANSWGGLPFNYCAEGLLDRFLILRTLEDVAPEPSP